MGPVLQQRLWVRSERSPSYRAYSASPADGNNIEANPVARTYWEDGEIKKEYYWGQEGKGNYWDLDPISRESIRAHEDVHQQQQEKLHSPFALMPWRELALRFLNLSNEEEMKRRLEREAYRAEYDFLTN